MDALTAKIDAKIKQDEESFSNLTSTTKASITTSQTAADGELREALKELNTSSSGLITESQKKLSELEQQLATRSEETVEANHKKTEELIADLAKLKIKSGNEYNRRPGSSFLARFRHARTRSQSRRISGYTQSPH